MTNLTKLVGSPCNASDGCLTRPAPNASKPGDLGMGKFNPRSGGNAQGKWLTEGVASGNSKVDLGMGKFNPRDGRNAQGYFAGGGPGRK